MEIEPRLFAISFIEALQSHLELLLPSSREEEEGEGVDRKRAIIKFHYDLKVTSSFSIPEVSPFIPPQLYTVLFRQLNAKPSKKSTRSSRALSNLPSLGDVGGDEDEEEGGAGGGFRSSLSGDPKKELAVETKKKKKRKAQDVFSIGGRNKGKKRGARLG